MSSDSRDHAPSKGQGAWGWRGRAAGHARAMSHAWSRLCKTLAAVQRRSPSPLAPDTMSEMERAAG